MSIIPRRQRAERVPAGAQASFMANPTRLQLLEAQKTQKRQIEISRMPCGQGKIAYPPIPGAAPLPAGADARLLVSGGGRQV
jgi:hypothetical protein